MGILKPLDDSEIILLCGPTASGKTEVALRLALETNAEIISADSGQIYRGLNIGTAKPTPEQRKAVRIHLMDILNPDQRFSAAEFRNKALQAISEIRALGKRVIVAGGTGLYLRALEEGLFEGPAADTSLRAELARRIDAGGCSVHSVIERIEVMSDDGPAHAWVLATNVYAKTVQGWRMVAHHASPGSRNEPADALSAPPVLH